MDYEDVKSMLSAPDEVGAGLLSYGDVLRALDVPAMLCAYMDTIDDLTEKPIAEGYARLSDIPEPIALDMLRVRRQQPRLALAEPSSVVGFARAGRTALDWTVNDPWLRTVVGIHFLKAGFSVYSAWESELKLGRCRTDTDVVYAFKAHDTRPALAWCLAGACVLGHPSVRGIIETLSRTSEEWYVYAMRYGDRHVLEQTVLSAIGAWESDVVRTAYDECGSFGRLRDNYDFDGNYKGDKLPDAMITESHIISLRRLVGLLGDVASHSTYGVSPEWRNDISKVTFPYKAGPVWTVRYIEWFTALAHAMDGVCQRKGLPPESLPCLHPDDPEASAVVDLRERMWKCRVAEVG